MTSTVVIVGKKAFSVNSNFFLCNVPVKQHASAVFQAKFPHANRLTSRTRDDLKQHLQKARASPPLVNGIADFGLLTYLMTFPQIFDHASFMPALCSCVVDRTVPLDEGYALIMCSFAGLDF